MIGYNSITISLASFANVINFATAFSTINNNYNNYNNIIINTHATRAFLSNINNSKIQQRHESSRLFSTSSSGKEEEEWHPRDPAKTTPQLLSSLWSQIAQGCKNLSKGVSFAANKCVVLRHDIICIL